MLTVKLFQIAQSQAVPLPEEYQFDDDIYRSSV